ncbi:hypothetical protein HGRIS_006020 [Hohenbuehelia grisea]|uniref:thioredoxin-dependent peroxiredoxin n=1 Tax=Hohenbuehelia grisea TaxID=104357 RepID=A0ABR3JZJ1_9AGAR
MPTTYHSLIGHPAPTITLPDHNGETYSLVPGQNSMPVALFFYPKSGSFGCTKEACQFRDAIAEKDTFKPGKVLIVGVSPDPVDKQRLFVEKQKLTYPVLSDESGAARAAYGVGRGLLGLLDVARVTFVIDGKGILRDVLDTTMNYGGHSKFVARWLDRLEGEIVDAPDRAGVPTVNGEASSDVDEKSVPKLDSLVVATVDEEPPAAPALAVG